MSSPLEDTWQNGRWLSTRRTHSPNLSPREPDEDISLIILHNISLPPFEYNTGAVEKLFTSQINPDGHPFFSIIRTLRVSSHFLISRKGETVRFVSYDDMAYHTGISSFQGREKCNTFSIDTELEDYSFKPFTGAQYTSLQALLTAISEHYPIQAVAGRQDITPDGKTNPGHFSDQHRFQKADFPIRRR